MKKYLLIKYIIYPGLGLILKTPYPIVAVVSTSMEHEYNFDSWWELNKEWYLRYNITKEMFKTFQFKDGFNKGDIMILYGKAPADIEVGEIIVFKAKKPEPIIHRVIRKWKDDVYHFQTKGDNNIDSIKTFKLDETDIREEQIIGKAVFRIPLLGYIKIWFVELIKLLRGG